MDDGGSWGKHERGVFTDRTRSEIEYIDAVGDRFWWLVVVPGVVWFAEFEFGLWIWLRVLYLFPVAGLRLDEHVEASMTGVGLCWLKSCRNPDVELVVGRPPHRAVPRAPRAAGVVLAERLLDGRPAAEGRGRRD